MHYQKGIQRIFVALAIGWVAAWGAALIWYLLKPFPNAPEVQDWLIAIIAPLFIGYLFCYKAIPWVAKGFGNLNRKVAHYQAAKYPLPRRLDQQK
jgi:hypothetical protein